jgi:hypothetical protein
MMQLEDYFNFLTPNDIRFSMTIFIMPKHLKKLLKLTHL